jgi:hypothetical protein
MQRVVIKTHTNVWNNAIKNRQTKFKGKPKQGNIVAKVQTSVTNLGSNLYFQKIVIRAQEELIGTPSTVDVTMTQLLEMRKKNICHYAQNIDTYAPCIITSAIWNNDVKIEANCTTTDRRQVWNKRFYQLVMKHSYC